MARYFDIKWVHNDLEKGFAVETRVSDSTHWQRIGEPIGNGASARDIASWLERYGDEVGKLYNDNTKLLAECTELRMLLRATMAASLSPYPDEPDSHAAMREKIKRYLHEGPSVRSEALALVDRHRDWHDEQFGEDRVLPPDKWVSLMTEELGEFAQAVNDHDRGNAMIEVVQVGALAVAIMEQLLSGQFKWDWTYTPKEEADGPADDAS